MNKVSSIFSNIINAIFPKTCSGCGEYGTFLCEKCLTQTPQADTPAESFISAIFSYQHKAVSSAIWRFKYKNARGVAEIFGEKLYEEIIGELGDDLHVSKKERFLLIPIPLHKKRLRERGYNQSELLAHEITRHDTEKMFEVTPNALTRTRETNAQAKKEKRGARFENLRGAFSADSKLTRGRNIILIDDVTTTGATLTEARKALLKAGAREVRAWAVAH